MNIIERIKNGVQYRISVIRWFLTWYLGDYYVVSFPKSGRTWVRTFLAKYISEHFGVTYDDRFQSVFPRGVGIPRIVFTHMGLRGEKFQKRKKGYPVREDVLKRNINELKGKHVLFVARDPRDTVVSRYFHLKKRMHVPEVQSMSVSDFIRHKEMGIERIIWYLNTWYACRSTFASFTVVRYEDLREDPKKMFRKVLISVGIPRVDEEAFLAAIQFSSFDNMKKLERGGTMSDRLRPANKGDMESYKVRKGKVGGYREYLKGEDESYVDQQLQGLNSVFGYISSGVSQKRTS